MAHAEQEVEVRKPVREVFEFLLDGLNNPRWRSGVLDIERVPGSPRGVGAAFKQGMKGPGGRIDVDYRVVECVQDSLIKFEVTAGPARPTGIFRLRKEGGSTSVSFVLDFQPRGLARLMEPMINRQMQAEVGALGKLKEVMEGASNG